MNDDIRNRLKVEHERLADLEDDLASAEHAAATGEAEAVAAHTRLLDEIERQKALIRDLEEQSK
jgi:hypothetical protein